MRIFKIIGIAIVLLISVLVAVLWWTGRTPQRPPNLSVNALYIERGVVPFKLSNTGEWLDCWFDKDEHLARCKLTNMNGWAEFEDVFLPYSGQAAISETDLMLDRKRTGRLWGGTYEKGTHYPIVYLSNGDVLLPRSEYETAKRAVSLQ
jgi:hypothetical protein